MRKKYPASLFWAGVVVDICTRFGFLLLASVILLILGIWYGICLYIGVILLVSTVLLSIFMQLQLRKATLAKSDDPEYQKFQEAVLSPNWKENIAQFVEERMDEESVTCGCEAHTACGCGAYETCAVCGGTHEKGHRHEALHEEESANAGEKVSKKYHAAKDD